MVRIRKNFEAAFKAKVALEAIKGEKTLTQLASHYKGLVLRICARKKTESAYNYL